MLLITRKLFNYLFGIALTYLIYFFPIDYIFYLLFNKPVLQAFSIVYASIFYLFIILYFKKKVSNTFFRVLIFEGMGIGFISLCVLAIIFILENTTIIKLQNLGITASVLIFTFASYGLINANLIKLRKLHFFSNKVKKQFKMIFISDVHLGSNSKNHIIKIIKIIQGLKFDAIIIGGDLLDSERFNFYDLAVFKKLAKPIFYVTGNHELYLKNWSEIKNKLDDFNIKLIDRQSFQIHQINVIGIGEGTLEDQKKKLRIRILSVDFSI